MAKTYFGTGLMTKIYLGINEIAKIYLGTGLVYENTPPTPQVYNKFYINAEIGEATNSYNEFYINNQVNKKV